MSRRRGTGLPRSPRWSRRRLRTLVGGAAVAVGVLIGGVVLAVAQAVTESTDEQSTAVSSNGSFNSTAGAITPGLPTRAETQDSLSDRPMAAVPESASRPGPVSGRDPGEPIVVPPATDIGPAGVLSGFPHTPEGALAQLAAIDQAALQSGSMDGARAVIRAWAMPGGPTTTSWSGVQAMRTLLDAVGLSGGGSGELAVVLTPLMGQIKGTVGPDYVVPCVDFELDVTLEQTARGATADCQRMVWQTDRWLIGPGPEPATPPSVWPGTDLAISVGYRDLRHG